MNDEGEDDDVLTPEEQIEEFEPYISKTMCQKYSMQEPQLEQDHYHSWHQQGRNHNHSFLQKQSCDGQHGGIKSPPAIFGNNTSAACVRTHHKYGRGRCSCQVSGTLSDLVNL